MHGGSATGLGFQGCELDIILHLRRKFKFIFKFIFIFIILFYFIIYCFIIIFTNLFLFLMAGQRTRAILNFTPGPQGGILSPRGNVHTFVHPKG
jgi:hypothetical protein